MKSAVTFCSLLAVSMAQYHGYAGHGYAGYAPAPYYAPGSQFHAQDEFGNLNYGYENINSVKQEVGNTYGGVTGGYSYVDANGILQTVRYIADGLGFRVEDSRLPVAPSFEAVLPVAPVYDGVAPTFNPVLPVAPVYTGVAPTAPEVTPEVAAATAEHLAAHAAIVKREADPAVVDGHTTVSQPLSAPHLIHNPPLAHHAVVAAPHHVGYAGLGYHGLGYAGLGYAGLGHAGLGYAGLGHAGLGYAGLGHAGLGYAGLGHAGLGHAGLGYAGLGHLGYARW